MTEPETNPETAGQQRAGLAHLPECVAALGEGNRNAGTYWAARRATEAGDGDALAAIAKAYHEHRPRSALGRQHHPLRPADGQPEAASDREAATFAGVLRGASPKVTEREAG